jgi:signal transduction histidine kinase
MMVSLVQGQAWTGEMHARRPDGSEYDAATTIAPVLDSGGRIINLVAVMHDITAQKQIDRMRSKFVANVSHELRTPITNLKLYRTLMTDGDPERFGEYLDTLGDQLDRLERLVEDLLDLSRLDRGAMAMHPEDVNINDLVAEVVRSNTARANLRRIRLVAEPLPDLPSVSVDHERMTQVLVNLISNALNYSPQDTTITIRTGVDRTGDGPRVVVSVADQGSGISPEDLPFIFERFFRSEGIKATGLPGTGLGLSIVQEILELHGGRITVQSTPGKGSTFTAYLPVKSAGALLQKSKP